MRESRIGTTEQRFFKRFEIDRETGCWNWTGAPGNQGYGMISGEIGGVRYVPAGGRMLAHRVSWIIHYGAIPKGEGAHGTVVMHICDNRRCVNPKHLRLGSQADNVKDMYDKGRNTVSERNKRTGIEHFRSALKNQADVDLICKTKGKNKELAKKFGIHESTIKAIRLRNGVKIKDAHKFKNKPISQKVIDHIRSTPKGTRGLGKLYGVGKTTIANIRKGLTHKS